MRVLLTAGGTREPIDDVRVIANTSTGRLGARLAEAFAEAGHDVLLLHGATAVEPEGLVERRRFDSSADLAALLEAEVPRADVVIHAAAVSDYLPVRAEGKLSSDADEMVVRMRRAPKLIDGLRALAPSAVLVGFKLTSGQDEQGRRDIAEALRARADLDLVVSNEVARTGEQDHEVLIFGAEGPVRRATGKRAIARELLAAVETLRGAKSP